MLLLPLAIFEVGIFCVILYESVSRCLSYCVVVSVFPSLALRSILDVSVYTRPLPDSVCYGTRGCVF